MGSSASIVTESVVNFLKAIPPFQFLPLTELAKLSKNMTLEYFPKDTTILSAGMRAADSLYVVQKGGVKLALRTRAGKELILDMRSEGEIFGVLSLMGGDVARLDVSAMEDTLCYAIPAAEVQRLMAQHSEFADYLVRTSVRRYMDRSLNELRSQTHLMGDAERLLYSLKVSDVACKAVITCLEHTTVREAAEVVAKSQATCVVVLEHTGRAQGIVTDRDFTTKVVAQGLSLDSLVSDIMSSPVISVEQSALVFQALLAMLTHDIQHVLVTDGGLPKSVLTTQDLTLLQGKSPLSVARHIEQQREVVDLGQAQKRIVDLLPLLLREGAKASHITRVVAEINDRLIAKIFEIAHSKLGPPLVPYCWVVLGSEGRREQTFKTDQDNALIYSDEADAEAELYFERLTAFVRDALDQCGYPLCPGGYMATNPNFRMPLRAWQESFARWIADAELHATEDALILFDMRPVAGDAFLFDTLATHTRELLKNAGFFKSILASITIEHKPPLGFFRTFVVERDGEHKEELDIKMLGTGPIVNAARLFALDNDIQATNTLDRLTALQPTNYLDEDLLRDLLQAYEFLMLLR
ncbi:MAG TPA: DUF294 nucleotidyltransferase-like domain-containing protein, partial [Terriglobales bacterium]|nr:DUF294 nucleotidyltransferase-like domain-containing protein [Terriglobales bacterium]